MDQTDTTTGSSTNEGSQHSEPKDVFLSHSGKQKNFVRQLYTDLTNQGVSCFFDEDHESLPKAENFPPRIFEAAKTCKVALLLLSKDFLESKWPMLELSAFVEAKKTNSYPKILPLFFIISTGALKNTEENEEIEKEWKRLGIKDDQRKEWHRTLKEIRPINGLTFTKGGNEVEFRGEIVREIWKILPTPKPRYPVRRMQGEARMCQEVAELFNKVQLNEKRICTAGLYGIAGQGKTTLGKAFCNSKLKEFEGKVCHLEFSRGDPIQNIKLALQHLTHQPKSYVQTLTSQDEAKLEFYRRVKGEKVLLVLDNITDESIDEAVYYLEAEFGEHSWILLSARSADVLEKHFRINKQSCMRIPRLAEEEAIAILLEKAFPGESTLKAEDGHFALKCAKRCSFKDTSCDNGQIVSTFHPLALKAFGVYLLSEYGLNLSKWVDEIDAMVHGAGDGLDEVFVVLGKAFDNMLPKYRTIFILLTVYRLPSMSPNKVSFWLAINCNEEISFIEKAVEDLRKKAFIEEFKPEIRIHDLYIEFAQSKANKMERWLWWKKQDDQRSTRALIAQDKEGFESAKMEQCMYRRIAPRYLVNLFALQLVDVKNMKKLDLGQMNSLRSFTLFDCKLLKALDGMDKLMNLGWLQIRGVHPMFKLPDLSSFQDLQHLEIDLAGSKVVDQLGDLTHCFRLREIYVVCSSLLEFPSLKGMEHLEEIEFALCDKVKEPLDCRDCVNLQTVVLNSCSQMVASPRLSGCKKLSKLVLRECDAVTACPDVDEPSALKTLDLFISSAASSALKNLESFCKLENLQLEKMGELMELPSFRRLSNLRVLNLSKCGIREPPDLTGCDRLEDVHFFTLRNLKRFPNFSSLRELKKLSLYDCISVQDPPDIKGCHQLQVFHLLYNDNMKGLPNMDECSQLEEIKVSWHSKYEVVYHGIDTDRCADNDDIELHLEHFQDQNFGAISDASLPEALEKLQWRKDKRMLVRRYFRGLKLYYSLTAPHNDGQSGVCSKSIIILGMIDGKVMPLPRPARDSQDPDWFQRVQNYFAAKGYSAGASASRECMKVDGSLVHQPSPRYHVKMWKTRFSEVCHMDPPCFNEGAHSIYDLDFCGGNVFARRELSLLHLSQMPERQLESVISEDKARYFSTTIVECQKALLDLNPEHSRDEMRQVIAIELRKMCPEESTSGADHRGISVGGRCFSDMDPLALNGFNQPLVTKYLSSMSISGCMWRESIVLARDVFIKYRDELLKWVAETEGADDLFAVLYWLCIPDQAIKIVADSPADKWISIMNMERKLSDSIVKEIDQMTRMIRSLKNITGWSEREEVWRIDSILRDLKYINEGDGYRVIKEEILELAAIVWKKEINKIKLKLLSDNIVNRLAINCNEEINNLKEALEDLCKNAFIEESEPQNRIRDLFKEFAQIKKKMSEELAVFLNIQGCISQLLPLSPRYPVLHMQGGFRMSQEVADLFNKVDPNEKGIRIAGLYGMSGGGKTSLTKDFCNHSLRNFYGKVCHLEFCGGNALQRLKLVLQYLAELPMPLIESVTCEEEARGRFSTLVKGQRVLLVLDDVSYQNINEVKYYLGADFGENSCILLSGRSVDVLGSHLNIYSLPCMLVPSLEEEEAIAILWERKPSVASGFSAESRDFARKCIFGVSFHPLALKVFGRCLLHSSNCSSSDGLEGSNDVFVVLDKAFDCMEYQCRSIFIHLARHKPGNMSNEEAFKWLARSREEEIKSITEAVDNLFESAFIEAIEPEIRIHDLMKEFAQMFNKNEYDKFVSLNIEEFISPRYPVLHMQGGFRMIQEVADLFNKVYPNEKGIRIAGLYGKSGLGKTTLTKDFCNQSLRNFYGKVCHLEFCGGNALQRLKLVLQYFTELPMPLIESVTSEEEAHYLFSTLVKGQRVLLVLDDIRYQNINEVKYYLGADFGENSCILLSCRSVDVLEKHFNFYPRSCMRVPRLEEEEAIAILWEKKPSVASGFPAESRDFALKYAKKCSFEDDGGFFPFHPLALKVVGRWLFCKKSKHSSNWSSPLYQFVMRDGFEDGAGDGSNDVFVVLDKAFDCMEYKCRSIFIHLARHKPGNMSNEEAFKWLARSCKEEIKSITEAVDNLFESAFIEAIESEIRIHDLMKEFAQMTNKNKYDKFAFSNVEEYISHVDPLLLRYPVPPLQGEGRMCQKVEAFFNEVSPNEKGIRIAGLYGMSGQGKTMLAKAFCNRSLRTFDGKVCYLEFCGVNKLKRLKLVLQYLIQMPMPRIGSVANEDEARGFFNTLVKGKNVFLVLDNISEESIDEVTYYLQAELGENSCILLIARSVDLLVKHFNIYSRSCMRVPRLEEEEAIAILWERKPSVASGFPAESRDSALKCAEKCSFKRDTGSAAFHPLALKVCSRQLFLEQSTHFSIWAASCHPLDMGGDVSNNVFDMLDRAFDVIEDKRRSIFIHLARHKPPNMSTTEVFNWLAKTCNNEISYIEEAVKDLFESAFIEEMEPEIRIHELMKEFAQMTNKDEYAKPDKIVISSLLEPPSQRYHVPAIQGGTRMCQKVSDFFNAVLPNRKKIRIAGLYGLPGQGKTTLCKTFCNLNLKNFDGRVCHLEFCGGNKLDRQKLALEYLTHCSESQLESLTREDEAQKKLYKNVRGHRVLLVLDNITEDSIDEVKYYLDAKLGENSCVLLSTRSEDVLKKLNVNLKSRMSVPGLQEEEAIAILLEKVFPGEPTLEAEDRGFALKCAEICLFKETCCDNVPRAPTFHPLALKAFGRYLFSKYRSDLSKWAAEIDGMEDRADDGLKDMFIVLDKAFDCMCPINRAIFMLLTLYMLPSISPLNVNEWLAITCKKNIESIEEAVGDLRKKSFIEETEPEIRIHNVYMEFALSRARKLKRWLWFEGNLVTSEAKGELELADVEYNQHLDLSKIEISAECGLKNLWALEVVNENKEMSNLGISLMKCIRSFPSQISEYLAVLRGMENLPYLASLQVGKLPDLKTLNLRRLHALQYLEIAIGDSSWPTELGDLTVCVSLREIYVCCRSLSKFPLIHGLECLEKANFKGCDEVFGQLDCSGCVKLRSVVFEHCSQMAYIPLIADCSNLSKIVLNRCDPITEYSDENESYGLEISELCISSEDASAPRHSECCDGFKNLPLWNIVISSDVPSLRRLSNLTVLKLYKCDISEPPDVTYCSMLEDVYFSRLRCLQRFPNFSSLGKLKKLCLCNCTGVQYPPAIKGCQGLQVFHLIYNDNMESLPQMNGFPILEEIKLSWQLEEENRESCSDEDEELDDSHDDLDDSHDNLEICPNYQQDEIFRNLNDVFMPEELKKWQWIQDKTVRVKKYSRGLKKYYCMTAPYGGSGAREEASNGNTLEQFTIPTASTICG